MIKQFVIILSLVVSFMVSAHESPIAFAEMELNKEKQLELTLTIETDEILHYLEKGQYLATDFEQHQNFEAISVYLKRYLLNGFKVWSDDVFVSFEIINYEIKNNGQVAFYFISKEINENKHVKVKFDLMMDEHDHQQNKLIYIQKKEEKAYMFTNQSQQITIDNE
jgi:hypothetical protein